MLLVAGVASIILLVHFRLVEDLVLLELRLSQIRLLLLIHCLQLGLVGALAESLRLSHPRCLLFLVEVVSRLHAPAPDVPGPLAAEAHRLLHGGHPMPLAALLRARLRLLQGPVQLVKAVVAERRLPALRDLGVRAEFFMVPLLVANEASDLVAVLLNVLAVA